MNGVKAMMAKLISFDTVSRNSNHAMINYIQEYLAGYNIDSHLVPNADLSKANLYATIGPNVAGGVILSGHTDVVPIDDQDWDSDPFTLVEKDGKYFGRGTCDMKGFIAICLAAVPDMVAANLKRPIHFCFSYDEEVGCLGAVDLVDEVVKRFPPVEAAIIGEPTNMQVANLHKSCSVLITRITGIEAHSSKINLGVSANFAAAKLINFLSDVLDDFKLNPQKDLVGLVPNYSTVNIGLLHGGTAQNIMPRSCEFSTDIRTVPQDNFEKSKTDYEQFAKIIERNMQADNANCKIEILQKASVPSLEPEINGDAERLALNLTSNNKAIAVSYGTEAGLFQKAGYSTIVCGPGSIDQAHKPNEFIEISQVEAGIQFIDRLIKRTAS